MVQKLLWKINAKPLTGVWQNRGCSAGRQFSASKSTPSPSVKPLPYPILSYPILPAALKIRSTLPLSTLKIDSEKSDSSSRSFLTVPEK